MVTPQASGGLAGAPEAAGGASRRAIEFHYDVGEQFYARWLDPRLVYSCALWPDGSLDDDLAAAQTRKLAFHAERARATGRDRVLDVGCGWGSLMFFLLDEGAVGHVTGLTLSGDQARAVAERGYPGAEVRVEDWRDHTPEAPYDAIISIGAFEHFAVPGLSDEEKRQIYRSFFERCWTWLLPGGRVSLQTIGYEDFAESEGPVAEFFSEQVFPESMLPHLSDIISAVEPWFRVLEVHNHASQYEHTLKLWQRRLEANRSELTDLVGRDTYRHYLRYLRVSRAMFDRRTSTLYRVVLERRPTAGLARR